MRARMKMIHFERIRNKIHPAYDCALELYQGSFPIHEQREELSQAKILCDNAYHFEVIYDAEVFIRLVLYWETANYIYIEHLCILPEMRDKQYGQKTLSIITKSKRSSYLRLILRSMKYPKEERLFMRNADSLRIYIPTSTLHIIEETKGIPSLL